MSDIFIDGRRIGPDHPPYIIAELSGNHNGSLPRALELIDAAADTGCDAIKIQTYTPDTMTIDAPQKDFKISGGLWDGYTLYELYREAHTPYEWHAALFERARSHGVTLFSSPFDKTAVDLLEGLGALAYKIASFEIVDLELIAYVATKGKPIIMSTGLANYSDIERAVRVSTVNGCKEIILLHCISSYPASTEQSNLRTIQKLSTDFGVVTGLSDHTQGSTTAIAGVAVGASVIEKHFTLARADGGPDAEFSMEPAEFKRLCLDCKNTWMALGEASYETKPAEVANQVFRRSLYAVSDIAKGELLTRDNIRAIRPGYGLPPHLINNVLQKRAKTIILRGTALCEDLISD